MYVYMKICNSVVAAVARKAITQNNLLCAPLFCRVGRSHHIHFDLLRRNFQSH